MKRGRPHGNSELVPAWLLRSRYEIETPEGVTRQTAEMELLEAGWRHFDAAEWAEARDTFRALLEASPREPAALDGLGQSLWWLGDRDGAIECRREAYAAYRRDGDARNAGRLAVYLAGERRIDGQAAEASGWLSRARRLLEGEGTCVELGWLAIEDAKRAGNPADAERHANAALEIAHALQDPDIECMALAQMGSAVVAQGRVDQGMALLDEAMTVALGGETSDPMACGDACCTMLVVCDGLADLPRAAQWCEAVVEFNERRNFTPVQSWCRGIFGGVLVRAGDWERAETVLLEAMRHQSDRRRGGGRALPLAALAELRLRQGRLEETEQLLEGLDDERVALAPLVGLQLQRGDLALARALLDRRDSDGDAGVLVLEGSVRSGGGRPRCRVRGRGRVAGARPGARPRRRDRAECAPCRSCLRRARRCCDC